MLCVFAHQASDAKAVTGVLEPRFSVELKDRWTPFRRSARRSDCVIIVLRRLKQDRFVGRLASFRHRYPLKPLVLVTRREATNLRRVGSVRLDEIVWLDTMKENLPGAVERATTNTFFRRQAHRFENAEGLPPKLRRALVLACRCEQPVRSVNGLAEAVGCDRRTLWRQWRKTTGTGHLRNLLAWLQLIQAVSERSHHSTHAVASKLGLHEKTLGPLAKRLTGLTFGELASENMEDLLARFREELGDEMFDRIPQCDIFG